LNSNNFPKRNLLWSTHNLWTTLLFGSIRNKIKQLRLKPFIKVSKCFNILPCWFSFHLLKNWKSGWCNKGLKNSSKMIPQGLFWSPIWGDMKGECKINRLEWMLLKKYRKCLVTETSLSFCMLDTLKEQSTCWKHMPTG